MPEDKRLDRRKFLGAAGTSVVAASSLGMGSAAASLRTPTKPRTVERPQTAAAIAKSKPYLIGSPFPLHSFYAADGQQMKNGSGLAIDEINSSGGIGGRKITRIVLDADVATPEGVATAFRKL